MSRLRLWPVKPTVVRQDEPLIAKLIDGPLSGSTREIVAVEGRPPKTIEVGFGDRTARYCLVQWEQSGHSAIYGFLYEI